MRHMNFKKKGARQRGSSLVEFIFVAPIILVSAGATVDVARFAQTQQVTSFISQETASLMYRECLDKTVVLDPSLQAGGTESLTLDWDKTLSETLSCMLAVQASQQTILTAGTPGAAINSTGFRLLGTNLQNTGDPAQCGSNNFIGIPVPFTTTRSISGSGTGTSSGVDNPIAIGVGRGCSFYDNAYLTQQRSLAQQVWNEHPDLTVSKVSYNSTDRTVSIARRQGSVQIANANTACQKNRFVVVEVTFAFTPFVKFLPSFITGWSINQDGEMRETTIL